MVKGAVKSPSALPMSLRDVKAAKRKRIFIETKGNKQIRILNYIAVNMRHNRHKDFRNTYAGCVLSCIRITPLSDF